MWIGVYPDPDFPSRIRDPGYKKHWIPDPQQKIQVNFNPKNLYRAVGNMIMNVYSECEKALHPRHRIRNVAKINR
jgi:hypothetical protein